MELRARDRSLTLTTAEPLVMGILNVGSDSVADRNTFDDVGERVAYGLQLVADGADLVDIGAISGRTDTPPISEQDEIALLTPVVRKLTEAGVLVSVDTWRAPVVAAVLAAGAQIINDVSGLADPQVARLVAASRAGLVVMHTCAPPKETSFPGFPNPFAAVQDFFEQRLSLAHELGVATEQIILDPGLDYTKTPAESVAVLRQLHAFMASGRPLLLAVSRKYFVGMLTGRQPTDRLAGTLAALAFGVSQGATIVRVHDVAAVVDFLRVSAALESTEPPTLLGDPSDESLKWISPK
jgi:dihydropteroate synthase